MKKIDDDPWKDQTMGIFSDPTPTGRPGFRRPGAGRTTSPGSGSGSPPTPTSSTSTGASRDQHRVDVLVADPGHRRGEGRHRGAAEHLRGATRAPRRLENGDLIWWSERDGWAHLYRYGADGTLKARLTEGPWHVSGIDGVDETRGYVFFTANAREEGEDPYYLHLYRVGLDGSRTHPSRTPGTSTTGASMSESNRFFVDNYSRVNTVPAAALFDASGPEGHGPGGGRLLGPGGAPATSSPNPTR